MEPKQTERASCAQRDAGGPAWTSLYRALRDAGEWGLDLAAQLAAPYSEEVDAIERVRAFARARVAGLSVEIDLDDVLLTLGILIAAIDRPPPPPPSFGSVVGWDLPLAHYCPGANLGGARRAPRVYRVA